MTLEVFSSLYNSVVTAQGMGTQGGEQEEAEVGVIGVLEEMNTDGLQRYWWNFLEVLWGARLEKAVQYGRDAWGPSES